MQAGRILQGFRQLRRLPSVPSCSFLRKYCAEPDLGTERSVNSVTLLGRAGKDPEVRYTKENNRWVTFSLATSQKVVRRDPDSDEDVNYASTQWHSINVFNGPLQQIVLDHVVKGARVMIQGSLRYYPSVDEESKVTRMISSIIPNEVIVVSLPKKDAEPITIIEEAKPSRKKRPSTARITYHNMAK